jgi:predicted ATPase
LAIHELFVGGYRSIRSLTVPLSSLNVIVGPNGCGKTNLYRSMYLLAVAANGQFSKTLAEEGGMPSVLWAGERTQKTIFMTLGVCFDELTYTLACGPPEAARSSLFYLDPEVKEETISFVDATSEVPLLNRKGANVGTLSDENQWIPYPFPLDPSESVIAQLSEPHRFPQLSAVRQEFLNWRFYHQFRVDADSPIRQPQVGVRTPVLAHDGRDLAAAMQTILEIGDAKALREGVTEAFPGSQLRIDGPDARFRLALQMPMFQRPFTAAELSDGTLRYLCLMAALLSPRPPSVLALNEPETHLHPDLLTPLARLIVRASEQSQLWVTTHSEKLATSIKKQAGVDLIQLEKRNGETRVVGQES